MQTIYSLRTHCGFITCLSCVRKDWCAGTGQTRRVYTWNQSLTAVNSRWTPKIVSRKPLASLACRLEWLRLEYYERAWQARSAAGPGRSLSKVSHWGKPPPPDPVCLDAPPGAALLGPGRPKTRSSSQPASQWVCLPSSIDWRCDHETARPRKV